MSLINLFVAARSALAARQQRRRAYHELMALDDRSLADIGLHRSQLPALIESADTAVRPAAEPDAAVITAFGAGPRFATNRPWLPPI